MFLSLRILEHSRVMSTRRLNSYRFKLFEHLNFIFDVWILNSHQLVSFPYADVTSVKILLNIILFPFAFLSLCATLKLLFSWIIRSFCVARIGKVDEKCLVVKVEEPSRRRNAGNCCSFVIAFIVIERGIRREQVNEAFLTFSLIKVSCSSFNSRDRFLSKFSSPWHVSVSVIDYTTRSTRHFHLAQKICSSHLRTTNFKLDTTLMIPRCENEVIPQRYCKVPWDDYEIPNWIWLIFIEFLKFPRA